MRLNFPLPGEPSSGQEWCKTCTGGRSLSGQGENKKSYIKPKTKQISIQRKFLDPIDEYL